MDKSVLLVHHAANRGHAFPPSSLNGLRCCLEAAARAVEVDITPLADGDFALLHDPRLESQTDGGGLVWEKTSAEVAGLRLRGANGLSTEPVALLSQVVDLVRQNCALGELQLDLKASRPLPDRVLLSLLTIIDPIMDRVRVTSVADWALWRLHELAPELPLGFDPLLYLDVREEDDDRELPPRRTGVYGYRDDHPLALTRWGSPDAYLRLRAEGLWRQAPEGAAWYIRADTLSRVLTDGFDWITWLHERGALVDAWTLDSNSLADRSLARLLADRGVDRITTNDAPALAGAIGVTCIL